MESGGGIEAGDGSIEPSSGPDLLTGKSVLSKISGEETLNKQGIPVGVSGGDVGPGDFASPRICAPHSTNGVGCNWVSTCASFDSFDKTLGSLESALESRAGVKRSNGSVEPLAGSDLLSDGSGLSKGSGEGTLNKRGIWFVLCLFGGMQVGVGGGDIEAGDDASS